MPPTYGLAKCSCMWVPHGEVILAISRSMLSKSEYFHGLHCQKTTHRQHINNNIVHLSIPMGPLAWTPIGLRILHPCATHRCYIKVLVHSPWALHITLYIHSAHTPWALLITKRIAYKLPIGMLQCQKTPTHGYTVIYTFLGTHRHYAPWNLFCPIGTT